MLKVDANFTPCPVDDGDEIYLNGIFEFNITKMIEYIQKDTVNIPLEEVAVNDVYSGFSSVNESHMKHVEISTPIILAEIAPGRYNVIDGNHRLEKAHLYLLQGLPWHQVKKVPSV